MTFFLEKEKSMRKETITYVDYDGNERTEDFYFNISKAEAIEMQLSTTGGYDNLIQNIINSRDNRTIYAYFKEFLINSYGERAIDGIHFVKGKNHEKGYEFAESPAFGELIMKLITNGGEYAGKFVNDVISFNSESKSSIPAPAFNKE